MKQVADDIPGYSYGAPDVGQSAVSMRDLDDLKRSAGVTEDEFTTESGEKQTSLFYLIYEWPLLADTVEKLKT